MKKGTQNLILTSVLVFMLLFFFSGNRKDSSAPADIINNPSGGGGGGGGGSSGITVEIEQEDKEESNTISVYLDSGLLEEVISIEWGAIAPAKSVTKYFYLYDSQSHDSLYGSRYNISPPEFENYSDFYVDDIPIQANTSTLVSMTLLIHPDIQNISSFSFDIKLVAS